MYHYLLDAGGAGLIFFFAGAALLFLAIAIFAEALVMTLFKYHVFRKSLVQSLIVNLISVVVGIILVYIMPDNVDITDITGFLIMFGVTIVVEITALYLMNKDKPFSLTSLVSLVMNIITYFILYLFVASSINN